MVLTAIPKKDDKVGFRSMRHISLLLVIQKFYFRAYRPLLDVRENHTKQTYWATSLGDPLLVSL